MNGTALNLFEIESNDILNTATFAFSSSVDSLASHSEEPLGYVVTNLVSNNPDNDPQLIDPLVSLGWGIAIRPAGLGGHFWINNSGTGTVTEYVGDVGGVPIFQDSLKVVKVTPTAFNPFGISGPTGQVFNGSSDFVITQDHPNGAITAPSKFIFVASDGGISAWTERRNDDGTIDRPLESEVVVDKLGESVYYGAAITNFEADNLLYAVDFGPTPGIEVYDATFTEVTEEFEFINPFLDEGYAPYNIQNVNDSLFVAYAVPSPVIPGDEVIGPGLGRIAEFDLAGNLVATWEDESLLNAPWGFVAAPDNFGEYSNTLLVSNFGDGTIVAFDPTTRTAVDYLRDGNGEPIAIDGLWGLTFGNGGSLGETNDLYFAAGNDLGDNPGDGVFGKVEVAADVDVPAPGGDRQFEGTDGDDLFVVSGDRNVFSLGEGNDTVTARGLNQLVNAGDGNDIISIGSGTVDLGEGENFVTASAGSSTVTAGSGDDTVNLVKGVLEAEVGDGNNSVTSGAGDDLITAGAGDDSVHAGAGTNTIALGEGDNTIDTIVNQGNFLVSIGQNTVTTGSGSDTFRIGAGEGLTTITNFDDRDRFELVGFKPDFSGALSFSDLSIIQDGADTIITLSGTEDVLAVLQNTQADAVDANTFGEPIPNELEVGLFDARNDTLIKNLEENSEVLASELLGRQVTIAASVPDDSLFSGQVESIFLDLNNCGVMKIENVEPYALFGDREGDLSGRVNPFKRGENSISFDLYSGDRRQGDLLDTVTQNFTVVDDLTGSQNVIVGLFDVESDALITILEEGTEVLASSLANRDVTIAAFVDDDSAFAGQVESMVLNLNNGQVTKIENAEPYALFGDVGGDFRSGIPLMAGDNSISFELYSSDRLQGDLLATANRDFTVINDLA